MSSTKIEWTEATWNPVTGCSKISPGCMNCYAEKMITNRLSRIKKQWKYKNGFKVTCHPSSLKDPIKWKKGKMIFVNSMSDLFHTDVPLSFIQSVFSTMKACPQHTFQVLTKRSDRLAELNDKLDWAGNVYAGVSIENADCIYRMEHLKQTDAAVKFLSIEPLLGPLPEMDLSGINWTIVGGESGSGARPIKEKWVLDIRDQCLSQGVPFFFKQWGGKNKKKTGRLLQGKEWSEMP